ncbi:MAG: UDP-N-acetylmuramoyl-tripeptide--D-alanyl-D-alanine ligase [Parcubacteria group bacterium Gr01-1014_8]|nr:MAG: UDP-N-acetylmuramoyl-tripeptide--D-alanyl-D-alanine ligase [Parcubacteria group bacterium Gr01-1014_8]
MPWLSRYLPSSVRSLIYMLQASEYNIRDYVKWLHRVEDFRFVEHRKKLVWTPKAILLYVLAWSLVVLWLALAFSTGKPLVVGIAFLVWPFLLAYGLILVVLALRAIQLPIELLLIGRAKQRLSRHKALKIAIAGSYGKTSMREILKTVLSEGKKVAAPPGSYNTPLGIAGFVKSLKGDEDVLVFELGEYYRGDIKKLCRFVRPSIGIITGVNEAHLEKFGTLENTADTIFELAEYLQDKFVYVNAENDISQGRALKEHTLYSREGVGNWKVSDAKTRLEGTSCMLANGSVAIHVRSKLLGLHQIGPLAVAVDIATSIGLAPSHIETGIAKTSAFPHRLEPKVLDGVTTLDDSYNGSPDGVKAVIEFLASLPGRRLYVTPGLVEMGSRAEEVHKEIGRQLARAGIEKIVLIKNSVTLYIEKGLREAGFTGEMTWFDDGLAAYIALPHMTVKGDVVLLQNDWPDQYV